MPRSTSLKERSSRPKKCSASASRSDSRREGGTRSASRSGRSAKTRSESRSLTPSPSRSASALKSRSASRRSSTSRAEVGSRSKVIAALIAWFVGVFGIHNFYLGHTKKGVIQLVLTLLVITSPISVIWVLIDFIKILMGSVQDVDGMELS